MVCYISNLMHSKKNNTELLKEFRKGAFGVKITKQTFSRAPVDLALEQSVNADAANSLIGISHFSNSISARQRWAVSHSLRTKIISSVLLELGITETND